MLYVMVPDTQGFVYADFSLRTEDGAEYYFDISLEVNFTITRLSKLRPTYNKYKCKLELEMKMT